MSELALWTLEKASEALERGEVSSVDLTDAVLSRTERLDDGLGAFLRVDAEGAKERARESDARRSRGEALGPLDGIPVAVKDNFSTRGVETTCASRMLEGFRPPFDATAVERLQQAGAIVTGKLNMDEFAMGSTSESSAVRPIRNPWDRERVPGGSSGGSAVAVAAGLSFGSLGTDTGGSIRQPAALCGVVGIKPTYGRVSRYGVVSFASSLDTVGPMGRTVRDAALQLGAVSGHDPLDSTSVPEAAPDFLANIEDGVKGLKLGVPKEYFVEGMAPEVERAVREAIDTYRRLGAEIREISLPHTEYAVATYYVVATAEASSNFARYDGVRYGYRAPEPKDLLDMYERTRDLGFGHEVKRRIMLGTFVLSSGSYDAYYVQAQKARTLIRKDYENAFSEVDAILAPTSPSVASKVGAAGEDVLAMYLADIFTIPANLAGLPGLSLPCGFSESGLPMGLQVIAPPLAESTMLRVARAYERETDWHERRPSL